MRLTAILLALALAVPAHADHKRPWPDASQILVPPAKYAKPYVGHLNVRIVPHEKVFGVCRHEARFPQKIGPRVLACAVPKRGSCTIVLPEGMPADLAEAVFEHEGGHCRGWKHPNRTGGRG